MAWIFASVVLALFVYNPGFRRWTAWLAGAAVVLVTGIYLFSTPAEPDAGRVTVILATVGGVWALAKTFPALLRPREGSAAWARARIRNLYAPAVPPPAPAPSPAAPWLSHGDVVAVVGVAGAGCIIFFLIVDEVAAVQGGYDVRWVLITLGFTGLLVVVHAIGGAIVARLRRIRRTFQ